MVGRQQTNANCVCTHSQKTTQNLHELLEHLLNTVSFAPRLSWVLKDNFNQAWEPGSSAKSLRLTPKALLGAQGKLQPSVGARVKCEIPETHNLEKPRGSHTAQSSVLRESAVCIIDTLVFIPLPTAQ